jgi:3-oxoacyl-[acyl-carrier protein] reductase
MDLGIADRVALVLGSTSGLGAAVARALADEGVRVAITGRRIEMAAQLAGSMKGSAPFQCDLTSPGAARALVAAVGDRLGPIDILVLNSGGPPTLPATQLTAAALRESLEVLLVRQVEFVNQVLPAMREQKWGRIIAIGSTSVQEPIPHLTLSSASRAALAAYMKTLAGEVAADRVTVNMVLPGLVETDRLLSLTASAEGATQSPRGPASQSLSIPAGRYGEPAELAAVVAFLAGTGASYMTGAQVRCDGGLVRGF